MYIPKKDLYAFCKLTVSPAESLKCPSPYLCLLESWQLPVSLTFLHTDFKRCSDTVFPFHVPILILIYSLMNRYWANCKTPILSQHVLIPQWLQSVDCSPKTTWPSSYAVDRTLKSGYSSRSTATNFQFSTWLIRMRRKWFNRVALLDFPNLIGMNWLKLW